MSDYLTLLTKTLPQNNPCNPVMLSPNGDLERDMQATDFEQEPEMRKTLNAYNVYCR
jgi:hypothetical protein